MMKWVMSLMIVSAVIFAAATGNMSAVSEAFLGGCSDAVELTVSLIGIICLWSGLMRAARASGITEKLSSIFSPILGRLFGGLRRDGEAMQYITLNLTANLLGLGNASTPFGLAAMRGISAEENAGTTATRNMIMLAVLNSASLQLIPTTAAALRLKYGSAAPLEILPCVWVSSAVSLTAAIIAVKLLGRAYEKRGRL